MLTNEAGAVVERLSYDAWGKRRYPDGTDDPAETITSQTTRGFTEHEMLADVGLIHMNGRVYDPLATRFAPIAIKADRQFCQLPTSEFSPVPPC